jgi:peptidoglycan/LPS O-acetylase OafA/YrhL
LKLVNYRGSTFNKNTITLADIGNSRNNNLNFLRLLAAILVISSHSIPLTRGASSADWLSDVTHGYLSFGSLAVGIFLLMSGYLIASSVERRRTLCNFFGARCSRIFPQLIFVVFSCAFIGGPLFSSLPLAQYFADVNTWLYLLNAIFIMHHALPGVFEKNIYPYVVNGALWILSIEFFCYILAYILFFFCQKHWKYFYIILSIIFSGIVIFFIFIHPNVLLVTIIRPILLFLIGMGAYVYRNKIYMSIHLAIAFGIAFVIFVYLRLDVLAMLVCFPYVFFYVAFATKHKIFTHPYFRENSYGLYLWGWPVEQALCQITANGLNWWGLVLISLPIAYGLGLVGAKVSDKLLTIIKTGTLIRA